MSKITQRVPHNAMASRSGKNKTQGTKKQSLRFLNLKPRRSLYKLRLKFVQTTAEVSRKYYVLTNLSTRTH